MSHRVFFSAPNVRLFPVPLEPNELHMLLFITITILVTNICSVDHHVNFNTNVNKKERILHYPPFSVHLPMDRR